MNKRNRSVSEKIIDCLTSMNLHEIVYKKMQSLLMNRDDINTSVSKMQRFLVDYLQLPQTGKPTRNYWISRGWSVSESAFKAKQTSASHPKRKSPFSKEFWMGKINDKTGAFYTENESIFEQNSRRPIRKEYWLLRGQNETQAEISAIQTKNKNNRSGGVSSAKRPKDLIHSSSHRRKEYWLLRGYDDLESKSKVSRAQSTFSLVKCIEKYGSEDGLVVWKNRQALWMKTMNSKTEEERRRINKMKISGGSISKAELEIVETLKQRGVLVESQHCINSKVGYVYDMRCGSKLIEYNGDYWHANPNNYDANFFNKTLKKFAKDIWECDKIKIDYAVTCGFDVLVVWEDEYKKNPSGVLRQCIAFLTQ